MARCQSSHSAIAFELKRVREPVNKRRLLAGVIAYLELAPSPNRQNATTSVISRPHAARGMNVGVNGHAVAPGLDCAGAKPFAPPRNIWTPGTRRKSPWDARGTWARYAWRAGNIRQALRATVETSSTTWSPVSSQLSTVAQCRRCRQRWTSKAYRAEKGMQRLLALTAPNPGFDDVDQPPDGWPQ